MDEGADRQDDRYLYAAFSVSQRTGRQQPLLARYHPVADRWETLLEFHPGMAGRAPFYSFLMNMPLVRVGQDGHMYIGFLET